MTDQRQIAFKFALMGERLEQVDGVIALDVGSQCVAGVIDHHFRDAGNECAASLVAAQPWLVTEHVAGGNAPITLVLHQEPDFDCVASAYLAQSLILIGELPPNAEAIARYAREVDAGRPLPGGIGEDSVWALFVAAVAIVDERLPGGTPDVERFTAWVGRGMALLRAAVTVGPAGKEWLTLPASTPGWDAEREFLRDERARYENDLRHGEPLEMTLPTPEGRTQTVRGLRMVDPDAVLFKHLVRADGFILTHVIWSAESATASPRIDRHVISVAPGRGVWLKGLGAALEAAEELARRENGPVRLGPRRWPDVTNGDPWYDGRSTLHDYTIVDTPNHGTVLSRADVSDVLGATAAWIPLGKLSRRRFCPRCRKRTYFPEAEGPTYCGEHRYQLVPEVLSARYNVAQLVGAGGQGVVCEAWDREAGRQVAIKIVLREWKGDDPAWWNGPFLERIRIRFEEEIRALAILKHKNIVEFLGVGADPAVGIFLVTEFVRGTNLGRDLSEHWGRGQHYPLERARAILEQILQALDAIHAASLLHRDIKPTNVILTAPPRPGEPDPFVKLTDFGISRMLREPEYTRLTPASFVAVTPDYAAPEQQGKNMREDPRSDLYGLGTMAFEMLTDVLPFGDVKDPEALGTLKLTEDPPRVGAFRKDLAGTRLEGFVAALLARRPSGRPQSAAAALDRLRCVWPD